MSRARKHKANDWVAITVHPYAERDVVKRLREQAVLAYSPRLLTLSPRANTEEPMFPEYVFASFDSAVEDTYNWRALTGTRGISGLVYAAGNGKLLVSTIPSAYIEGLRSLENDYGFIVANPCTLQVGERVRIGGPKGAVGEITSLDPAQRVSVMLNMLGKPVEVKLLRTQVQSLEAA